MKKNEKFALADHYVEMLTDSTGFILMDYRGLTVAQITDLRRKLRDAGSKTQVVRNRIFAHAVKDKPYSESLAKHLEGPTAVVVAYEDAIGIAKILNGFKSDNEKMSLKAAILENEYLDESAVQTMHKLKSKKDLLAAILGSIQAPARNLLSDIQGPARKIAGLLRAYEQKLEEAA